MYCVPIIALVAGQAQSRLKGLDAVEVYLVTMPKEFTGQPVAPTAADLRTIVDHRLTADRVPTASFLAVAGDPAKVAAYESKKKGHLMVEVQLVRAGDGFAYDVQTQVVEDAKIVRTGSSILAPIWSRAAIGVVNAAHLRAVLRDQVVDEIDTLAADWAKVN